MYYFFRISSKFLVICEFLSCLHCDVLPVWLYCFPDAPTRFVDIMQQNWLFKVWLNYWTSLVMVFSSFLFIHVFETIFHD
jgi:hypothetical protein